MHDFLFFNDCSSRPTRVLKSVATAGEDIFGRSTTINGIPSVRAASSFDCKPPASPDSLVTTQSTFQLDQRATFTSVENGPCIAQIFERGTPNFSARSNESASGVILKNQ